MSEEAFVKKFLGALTQTRKFVLFGASTPDQVCDQDFLNSEKTLMAYFSPLASGRPTIPTRAPVKSDLWGHPRRGREAKAQRSCAGIAREELQKLGFVSEAN